MDTTDRVLLLEALQALFESASQAQHDFCGEQRAWHLPRLRLAMTTMIKLFPLESTKAMGKMQTPFEEPGNGG